MPTVSSKASPKAASSCDSSHTGEICIATKPLLKSSTVRLGVAAVRLEKFYLLRQSLNGLGRGQVRCGKVLRE